MIAGQLAAFRLPIDHDAEFLARALEALVPHAASEPVEDSRDAETITYVMQVGPPPADCDCGDCRRARMPRLCDCRAQSPRLCDCGRHTDASAHCTCGCPDSKHAGAHGSP